MSLPSIINDSFVHRVYYRQNAVFVEVHRQFHEDYITVILEGVVEFDITYEAFMGSVYYINDPGSSVTGTRYREKDGYKEFSILADDVRTSLRVVYIRDRWEEGWSFQGLNTPFSTELLKGNIKM